MFTRRLALLLAALGTVGTLLGGRLLGQSVAEPETRPNPRQPVIDRLVDALAQADKATESAEKATILESAADQLLEKVPQNVLLAEQFAAARQSASQADAAERAKLFRKAIEEAISTLKFQPLLEAPLPEGFPEPTPVGVVEVKQIPAYRLARTASGGDAERGSDRAFWTLFKHIEREEIAMTAPVEMTLDEREGKLDEADMAFLYRSLKQGELGQDEKDGKVSVVETTPAEVLSIGVRGSSTQERMAEAKQRLEKWLAGQTKYQSAGPYRMMGYNSPFVPGNLRYFEVQVPVKAVE
jgi:hypothetical protein